MKYLFVDRDGTLIEEPNDHQVDRLEKLRLKPKVIPSLLNLQAAGYTLIMITNQDGLGTASFPADDFETPHAMLMDILSSQGIHFKAVHICPHLPNDRCACRKPELGLVKDYLVDGAMDLESSAVIGDRSSDMELAERMGIQGFLLNDQTSQPRSSVADSSQTYGETSRPRFYTWPQIGDEICGRKPRQAAVQRSTKETEIEGFVSLDQPGAAEISTGLGFFDHMLEQLAFHSGITLQLSCKGDLHVDEHHTVEDVALVLGELLRQALGDKFGIDRYGFNLPMDEALASVSLDLSGRFYLVFEGQFTRPNVGQLPTELVEHFFRSLASSLGATLHIKVDGSNDHHKIEACFKAFGRALKQAVAKTSLLTSSVVMSPPSTKGLL